MSLINLHNISSPDHCGQFGSITAKLEKLKPANDDKLFVSFVDKIEKARRDLEAINQGCEMSNSHMIGEIESKLPAIVKKDWIEIVLKQDLESKPSSEKFEHLMNHLSESKKKAMYQLAETDMSISKTGTKFCLVTGFKTISIQSFLTIAGSFDSISPIM